GTKESSQSQQSDLNEALELAIAAVRDQPGSADLWDKLEKTGGFLNRVEDVAAVYRDILRNDLNTEVARTVGPRAVAYHETWLGDEPDSQVKVLTRVLELVPDAHWAFEQLTSILTLGERWDELLALYDRALEATTDDAWREEILDEAANIARDFAGEPKRAISYLQQQLKLRPESTPLATALERLLEREEEWEALIDLWHQRLDALGEDAPEGLQVRIATCWLDRLDRPDQSLAELRHRLTDHPDDDAAQALLERLLVLEPDSITPQVRDGVLSQLRIFYAGKDQPDQIIRVLTVALGFGDTARQIELHREIAEREVKQDRTAKAVDNYVSLLALGPDLHKDHLRLRHLTERCGAYGAYVRGLVAAADVANGSEVSPRRIALRLEAAHVYRDILEDGAAAIDLFAAIIAEPDLDPALALPVARSLRNLLEQAGRQDELLAVLERLAGLEGDAE
ncbi:MAG: tetratricopeptide repeat protein, partial [Nannocystaceae bacterium]